MLFFLFSLISSCMHTSFLKVKVTGFLSHCPLSTSFLREAKCSSFCRLAGTCWSSPTAVAESKRGQMALSRTSCLSMAGNSSDICGVSGRTGGALPAPTFSAAGCNLPGTTYGPQYLQRELDRRWLQVPHCGSGHALFCWLAAVKMLHNKVSSSALKRASHSQPEKQ